MNDPVVKYLIVLGFVLEKSLIFWKIMCYRLQRFFANCSYLAVVAGLCAEADYIFIPEDPPTTDWPKRICEQLKQARSFALNHLTIFPRIF